MLLRKTFVYKYQLPPLASWTSTFWTSQKAETHDYHKEPELSTETCTAQIHGANPYCTRAFPDSPQRWVCCICKGASGNTNFTAIFLDQDAREVRQAAVEVIKRFKQTSEVQAEHMMNERFATVFRECKADSLLGNLLPMRRSNS